MLVGLLILFGFKRFFASLRMTTSFYAGFKSQKGIARKNSKFAKNIIENDTNTKLYKIIAK